MRLDGEISWETANLRNDMAYQRDGSGVRLSLVHGVQVQPKVAEEGSATP